MTDAVAVPRKESWREALFNRRMLICVFIGFSSGLPLYLLINLLPAWLRSEGVDLKAIGLFALIQLPYTWKFLWSPLMDRFGLPMLGRRRGWMLATHVLLLVHPGLRPAASEARHLDHRLSRRRGRLLLRQPGHRARRIPPRDPARSGTGARQLHLRQRVPDFEPHPRIAGADPLRPAAVVVGVPDHRAVHAARRGDDAARARAAAGRAPPRRCARRSSSRSTNSSPAPAGRTQCWCCCSSSSTSWATAWPRRWPRRSTSTWASRGPTSASSPRTPACGRA